MRHKIAITFVVIAVLLVAGFIVACASKDDENQEEEYVTEVITVTEDQIFDFAIGDEIGQVKFRRSTGSTGSRVDAICYLDTLSRFPDQKINVALELLNQDAAQSTWEPVEWVQDTNEKVFFFIIPLVETIPSILNFRLKVYQYEYDEDSSSTTDDDTIDDDTVDDDTVDDDTVDDDAVDDDTTDDDTTDDDEDDDADDDTSPTPDRTFEAEAVFLFTVNEGQPGAAD